MPARAANPVHNSRSDYSVGRPKLFSADDRMGSANATRIPRVLLAEDDYLVATQAEAALVEAGYDVVGIAATANEATSLAQSQRPELVIMDIRLANHSDGVDAALRIHRDNGIRCIFATAHDDDAARRRAVPAQPLGWLPKPYSTRALIDLVKQAVAELKLK